MEGRKKISVSTSLNQHSLELFNSCKKIEKISKNKLFKKIIECGIDDYYGENEYDFSKLTPEMNNVGDKNYNIACEVEINTYNQLHQIRQEMGIESLSSLLRRFICHMSLDYFIDNTGLESIKVLTDRVENELSQD